jgi:hypothetical protein
MHKRNVNATGEWPHGSTPQTARFISLLINQGTMRRIRASKEGIDHTPDELRRPCGMVTEYNVLELEEYVTGADATPLNSALTAVAGSVKEPNRLPAPS